jgi:hypothetical protein
VNDYFLVRSGQDQAIEKSYNPGFLVYLPKRHQVIFFHKEHLGKLRVINAAPTFNTLLHRLESLCH